MNVTAKISLASKTESKDIVQLTFGADHLDGRNKEWAAFTPSLNLTMTVKPEVAALFTVGAAYTLTFTPQES
jgi:hypothetical protein